VRIDESHVILKPTRAGVHSFQSGIDPKQVLIDFHLICIKMIPDGSGKVEVR